MALETNGPVTDIDINPVAVDTPKTLVLPPITSPIMEMELPVVALPQVLTPIILVAT